MNRVWRYGPLALRRLLSGGKRAHVPLLAGLFLSICFISATRAADAPPQDPALQALAEAIEQIKSKYVGPLDDRKLVGDAIRGIVQGLDPFSDYLDAQSYSELRQDNSGRFGGLGLEVGMEAGAARVVSTLEGSPAERAGLRPGDLITRLDDTSVAGLTLEQTIRRARGAPDTSVVLTVVRSGQAQPLVFTLRRAIVQSRSVKSALLGIGYGYLRISSFNQRTAASVYTALADLYRDSGGSLSGLLIDLRDNPGGLLKSAVAVSSFFLPDNSLAVYTEAANADSRMRLYTSDVQFPKSADLAQQAELKGALKTVPLMLLVNSGSASAAEILAGALQDYRRATIAGTRTFGKGSVQVLVPLADGAALKLTTAYYFTPKGTRIQGRGVVPDALLDAGLDATGALKPAAHSTAAQPACADLGALPERLRSASASGEDCQLMRALDLLRHLPVFARS